MHRGRPKAFERSEALSKAIEVFWEKGFGGAAMSELTTRMGIGRQSLYDTFGDKRRLFLEAVDHYGRERVALLEEVLAAAPTPLTGLRDLFGQLREMAQEKSFCGCMVGNALPELGSADAELQQALAGQLEVMAAALEGCLEAAIAGGELPADRDPRALARGLVATTHGILLLGQSGLDQEFIDDALRVAEERLLGRP
ncbi:MAG: TetR family transcriptional regulator C-terminal domain-containing protein [Acidobacteriota bacterium]